MNIDLSALSDEEVGIAILNVYDYRISHAELGDPALIDFVLDVDKALADAELTDKDREYLTAYTTALNGDYNPSDMAAVTDKAGELVGKSGRTIRRALQRIHTEIGRVYREGAE